MTRPLRYALRMVVFLAAVAVVAALLHEDVHRFFLRNPPLNALILSVLALGVALSFRGVLSLDPEIAWIERFHRDDPSAFTSAPPPLLGPLAAILRDSKGRFALSATGMRSVLDGVDSRLDERRDTSRYLIALLIFLGLLGTFWGLLLTASSVGETIRSLNVTGTDPAEMFEKLRAGLEAPLSGMGTAFSTSLFGLASSLVLGFLDLQASQAQNRFANEVETWLTGLTRGDGAGTVDDEPPGPAYLQALLTRTAESFDELQLRLERSIEEGARVHGALRSVGERLAALTDEIRAGGGRSRGGVDGEVEVALLRRIAGALESQAGGVDDPMRAHLRSLDLTLTQLVEDAARGRDHAVDELRKEIRLLSRTLSALAERER
jgi:hypothetical protein